MNRYGNLNYTKTVSVQLFKIKKLSCAYYFEPVTLGGQIRAPEPTGVTAHGTHASHSSGRIVAEFTLNRQPHTNKDKARYHRTYIPHACVCVGGGDIYICVCLYKDLCLLCICIFSLFFLSFGTKLFLLSSFSFYVSHWSCFTRVDVSGSPWIGLKSTMWRGPVLWYLLLSQPFSL